MAESKPKLGMFESLYCAVTLCEAKPMRKPLPAEAR